MPKSFPNATGKPIILDFNFPVIGNQKLNMFLSKQYFWTWLTGLAEIYQSDWLVQGLILFRTSAVIAPCMINFYF